MPRGVSHRGARRSSRARARPSSSRARRSATRSGLIGGIVAHADLTDAEHLDEVLDVHTDARAGPVPGHSRRRRARPASRGAHDSRPGAARGSTPIRRSAPASRGSAERGLTYDTWHFHHQNATSLRSRRAVPDTLMVLDHFGTPLGVGAYADRREEIFDEWRTSIAAIAKCDNVFAKLGGLAMPDNGFGWHQAARPPDLRRVRRRTAAVLPAHDRVLRSRALHVRVELSGRPALAVVSGALERPQEDRRAVLPDERDAMFFGTATRVYRLAS